MEDPGLQVVFLALLVTLIVPIAAEELIAGDSHNRTNVPELYQQTGVNSTTKLNSSARKPRQLNVERIELPYSEAEITKQIIKIPPSVSKVRLIESVPIVEPKPLVHYRLSNRMSVNHNTDEGKLMRKVSHDLESQTGRMGSEDSMEDSNELTRNFESRMDYSDMRRSREKEDNAGLGRYYAGEEFGRHKNYRSSKRPLKKRKILNDGSVNSNGYASFRHRQRGTERDDFGFYEYEPMESIRYIKQFPSGLYGLKTVYAADVGKQTDKPVYGKYYETGSRATPLTVRRVPGKLKKTLMNPQYTTHNSQVVTNFGLSEISKPSQYAYVQPLSNEETSTYNSGNLDFKHPVASASENLFPVLTPGIRVIHPPKFPEPASSSLSVVTGAPESQKATIRDILEQDCPDYENLGFCESPPRYPMHQINVIVKKCAALMDVMGTTNYVIQQEYVELSERSNTDNTTAGDNDLNAGKRIMRKMSAADGIQACRSDLSVIEPGYAKEETSGRWFVIVQYPDITYQRLTTDTCKNPGKPCSGLTDMKCMKSFVHSGNSSSRSTKCVQKYAYHKLISWDPDSPDTCPRMRIFKFPSACVCHVGTV